MCVAEEEGPGLLWGQYPFFFFFEGGKMCMKYDFSGQNQGKDTGLGGCQI